VYPTRSIPPTVSVVVLIRTDGPADDPLAAAAVTVQLVPAADTWLVAASA
jgi:hypothetical protein